MNWKSILVAIVIVVILLVIGCSMINDLYPAKVPKGLAVYANKDPNHLGWQCMGSLKAMLDEASLKHSLIQADIEYAAKRDNLTYSAVASAGTESWNTAKAERESFFGANGLVWPLLTLFMGGASGATIAAAAVNYHKNATMYSQTEVDKITNGNKPA